MNIHQFTERVIRKLEASRLGIADLLVADTIKDIEAYRKMTGKAAGLAAAIAILKETAAKLEEEENE